MADDNHADVVEDNRVDSAERRSAAERLLRVQDTLSRGFRGAPHVESELEHRANTLLLALVDGTRTTAELSREITLLEQDLSRLNRLPHAKSPGEPIRAAPPRTSGAIVAAIAVLAAVFSALAFAISVAAFITRKKVVEKTLKDAGLI
ncbi:MAG TPA: hypothetical protein VNA69_12525 [Thermoanaerobaculia bacterium]|nr:hypothetical protein [Thermoanaerobaculia bacterium]